MGFLTSETGRLRLGWRVLLFIALFSAVLLLASLLPLWGLPWETLPVFLAALVAGWCLLAMDGLGPGALGFYLAPEAVKEALLGVGLGVGVALLVLAGMFAVGGVRWSWEGGSAAAWLGAGAAALWLFTLPAAAEEALMRGYLFQALGEAWGGLKALWATALLFALLHLGNPNLSPLGMGNLLAAGLFLGLVYLKTASLWWATGAHLGWNWALGFLGDLPVSGLELVDVPLVEPLARGPEWVSGGAFGPEASLVATVVLAGATLFLWKSPLPSPGVRARQTQPLILAGGRGTAPAGVGETS